MSKYFKINTYGCQMNVHESEKLAGLLLAMGYEECPENEHPNVIVFNTCCIRDTAERRALGNIGVAKAEKRRDPDVIIAVVGCMTQQESAAKNIRDRFPYVDIVLGTRNIHLLPEKINEILSRRERGEKRLRVFDDSQPAGYLDIDEATPTLRTSFPNAWVNIIYGCNNFCSYCIVPYVRGREISRSFDKIIDEAKSLVDGGYKEITLLGQNVNSYGNDVDDKKVNFANLLHEIDKIDGFFRVRFMTSHPKDLTEEVMDEMASSKKICSNLHLPLQSGSDKVLKDMNRRYGRERYLSLVEKLRDRMPDIGLTTDIMVGFPTETEEDFEDTLDIVKRVRFSNAFTFIYSPRKGTPAAKMPQIPYAIKQERISRLIKAQNDITKQLSEGYRGNVYEILAEDVYPKAEGMICGRTDSGRLVAFDGMPEDVGKFFDVRVTSARSASLFGKKEKNV